MRVVATTLLQAAAALTAADSGGIGPRPVKPYRAWCWSAHPVLTDHPVLYAGVNLDLLPGGGSNTTVAATENAHGVATLNYATGAEEPWDGQLQGKDVCPPEDASRNLCPTNNTAATADFMNSLSPGPRPLPGETSENASFYFGGTVINEWNPDPCVPTQMRAQTCERRPPLPPHTQPSAPMDTPAHTSRPLTPAGGWQTAPTAPPTTRLTTGQSRARSSGRARVSGATTPPPPSRATSRHG